MAARRDPPKMDHWLPEAAKYFAPPDETEDFDPAGDWQHSYVILDSAPVRTGRRMAAEGFLYLRRSADADGRRFGLEVEMLARKQRFGAFKSTLHMQCRNNRLGTPQTWKLSTVSLDLQDRPVEVTRVEETGRLENGRILRSGRRDDRIDASAAWTSNWSLFDAVQRLEGEQTEPLKFDMLEDLDLCKPSQSLSYWGTTEVELGGRTVRLVGFQQIGQGILPYHYWLDTSGRLIFAYGALRGFMFNPKARTLSVGPKQPGRTRR